MTGSENTIGLTSIRFDLPNLKLMVLPVCLILNERDAPSALDREAKSEADRIASSESGKVA